MTARRIDELEMMAYANAGIRRKPTPETMLCWIIEKSSDNKQVWGPYTGIAAARAAAGRLHEVITGTGLEHGQTMTRGAYQAAIQSGRIREV